VPQPVILFGPSRNPPLDVTVGFTVMTVMVLDDDNSEDSLDLLAETVMVVEEMTVTELIPLADIPGPEPDTLPNEERVLEVDREVEPELLIEVLSEVDEGWNDGLKDRVNLLVVRLLTKVVLVTNTPLRKLMLEVTSGRQLDGIVE
jgi:hypothetical protein